MYTIDRDHITNLVTNYGYIPTTEFDGKQIGVRRQVFTVAAAARVPADWDGDKRIVASAVVIGKRSACKLAWIFEHGFISVIG